MPPEANTSPSVILAYDSANPEELERGAREGWLPTLACIMRRGCWARLAGPEVPLELSLWTTIWSGTPPGRHGFYGHIQLQPGTYNLRRVTLADVQAVPFWAALKGTGRRVAVLDAPDALVQPGLDGLQLSHWASHYPLAAPAADPPSLLDDALQVYGRPVVALDNPESDEAYDQKALPILLERVAQRGELCRRLLARGSFDIIVAVFEETHTANHQFWRFRHTHHPLASANRQVLEAADREMGRLLAQLPPQANVMLLSQMGVRDLYSTTSLNEDICRKLGYLVPRQDGASALSPRSLIRNTLPLRWRMWLRRLLPSGAQDNLLADKYASSTDWARTTVFSIPALFGGEFRVNLRGREPQGSVEPGAEYDRLLERLEADLRQLTDDDGQPAIRRITRAGDLGSDTPPTILPDLFAEWRTLPRLRTQVKHPRALIRQDQPEYPRDSNHDELGFVAAAGPAICGRGDLGQLSPLDLAPTWLALLGQPPTPAMRGLPFDRILHAH